MLRDMKNAKYIALENWLTEHGPQGREALSYKSGIGFYTLGRILRGERLPTKSEQLALIQATGLNMATLFGTDKDEEESA